ncbi:MAG TPA: hypothetical protein VK517_16000 [Cyclobacteriaceae bacterium]|nr:hypothetical protein [Cyclobacteriaceae bacterium]
MGLFAGTDKFKIGGKNEVPFEFIECILKFIPSKPNIVAGSLELLRLSALVIDSGAGKFGIANIGMILKNTDG